MNLKQLFDCLYALTHVLAGVSVPYAYRCLESQKRGGVTGCLVWVLA